MFFKRKTKTGSHASGLDRVGKFKESVEALNNQFLQWCTSQVQEKPDKFLINGITDYLRHQAKLRQEFADVVRQEEAAAANGNGPSSYAPLLSLTPIQNVKTIHFIRHGEGYHNIGYSNLDANLTEKGWQQSHALGKHMVEHSITRGVQLVIVSPMRRALETCAGVFGLNEDADRSFRGWKSPPPDCDSASADGGSPNGNGGNGSCKVLMVAQTALDLERTAHPEIVTLQRLQFVAHELCRERLGPNDCDKRRSVSDTRPHFPAVDFSLIESDADTAWEAGNVESEASVVARGQKFLQYLMNRPETNIAVVCHSAFMWFTFSLFGNDYAPQVRDNVQRWYENCEMRTLVLSDGGGAGIADRWSFAGGKSFKEPQQVLIQEEHMHDVLPPSIG